MLIHSSLYQNWCTNYRESSVPKLLLLEVQLLKYRDVLNCIFIAVAISVLSCHCTNYCRCQNCEDVCFAKRLLQNACYSPAGCFSHIRCVPDHVERQCGRVGKAWAEEGSPRLEPLPARLTLTRSWVIPLWVMKLPLYGDILVSYGCCNKRPQNLVA